MLGSCAADHGHHTMHACQWPTPHHTDSPCLSPHPFFMLWCGRRGARQLHVSVCVCAESPLCIQCMGAHICVLIFLEAHGCPPPLLLFSPPHHVEERESKGEGSRAVMQSRHGQAWAGSGMSITNLAVRWHAMCCWMLMQSTRSTTQVRHLSHLDIPSISSSSRHFPSLSLTMRHNEAGECTTMQQSQYTRYGSNGRCCGGCREREQQKRREEEAQHLTHSHMYHLLLVCASVACRWRRTWAAGGGEERE